MTVVILTQVIACELISRRGLKIKLLALSFAYLLMKFKLGMVLCAKKEARYSTRTSIKAALQTAENFSESGLSEVFKRGNS